MYICTRVLFLLKRYKFTNLGMPAGSKGELKWVIPQQNKMKYSEITIRRATLGKRKSVRTSERYVRKSGVKLQCSTYERETTFGWSYPEVRKIEGLRNRDSTVL